MTDKRDEVHAQCKRAWLLNKQVGTFELATGVGKTFAALQCVREIPFGSRILFLSEVTIREESIRNDIYKFNGIYNTDLLNQYQWEFACYQSAYKWKDREYDLVIADEIHDSLTPEYIEFYRNNSYKRIIGLSATIDGTTSYENGYNKLDYIKEVAPIVYSYSLRESVNNDTTRNLNIYVINHKLDENKDLLVPFKKGENVNYIKSTERKMYTYYNKVVNDYYMTGNSTMAIIMGGKRASLLYTLPSKRAIIEKLRGNLSRTIIFGNNIEELSRFAPTITATSKDRSEFLDRFNKGEVNTICSAKILKQGANLELDNVILHSYSSSGKDFIQRIGRLRKVDRVGNIFIIVTENTKEVLWSENILNSIGLPVIYCRDVDDCLAKLKENV